MHNVKSLTTWFKAQPISLPSLLKPALPKVRITLEIAFFRKELTLVEGELSVLKDVFTERDETQHDDLKHGYRWSQEVTPTTRNTFRRKYVSTQIRFDSSFGKKRDSMRLEDNT